jgi:hypothetical protein
VSRKGVRRGWEGGQDFVEEGKGWEVGALRKVGRGELFCISDVPP